MPVPYVKKLAEKHGMSVDKAEEHWSKAKQRAADEGKSEDYAYITGIFKRMMGEKAGAESDAAERLYWEFDARKKGYGPWKTRPQSERDAFKQILRGVGVTASQRANVVLAAIANQAQAKRFLIDIGLHPTKIGQSDDNYVSWSIAKDSEEQDVVNKISEALGRSGKKVAKDYGPPIKRITKTIRWLWEVPGKGVMVFYPHSYKVGFMNKIEDDPGEE
jgi:uncharacterized protein YdbL (DUF1318 family)